MKIYEVHYRDKDTDTDTDMLAKDIERQRNEGNW